jgi:hypothetical protein
VREAKTPTHFRLLSPHQRHLVIQATSLLALLRFPSMELAQRRPFSEVLYSNCFDQDRPQKKGGSSSILERTRCLLAGHARK